MRCTAFALVLALVLPQPVFAFKVDTHTWLAENIWQEIKDSGRVKLGHLPGSTFANPVVPERVRRSILAYKSAFVMGSMGADVYPDMIAGQMTTHPGLALKFDPTSVDENIDAILSVVGGSFLNTTAPGWQTDDWLKHVRDAALAEQRNNRGRPSQALAFAYGYMLHAAMDTWAHSYVNSYSGDVFSISSNQKAAARHVVLESFINHLHEPFYGTTSTRQTPQRTAARKLAKAVAAPGNLFKRKSDKLSNLRSPASFVRRTLILNDKAATQYARSEGAMHVWAMWFWWRYSQQVTGQIQGAKGQIDQAFGTAVNRVTTYSPIWNVAESAKNQAVGAYELLDGQRSTLEGDLIAATTAFNTAQTNLLGGIANSPPIQIALNAVGGAIDSVLSMITGGPLLPLKRAYQNTKSHLSTVNTDLSGVIVEWQAAKTYRDTKARELAEATTEFNLRKNLRNALNHARGLGWQAFDQMTGSWTRNIELGVEAYTRAWEETIREIIRPHTSRYKTPTDPTWPIKEWAACWGPAFGLPNPLTPVAAQTCATALTSFNTATTQLDLLVKNTILPAPLRARLDELHSTMTEQVQLALPLVGGMIDQGIGAPMVGGTAAFAARLWDTDVDLADVVNEYKVDESGRGLPIYRADTQELRDSLAADLLPVGMAAGAKASFTEMLAFAPIHNAVMLSKLTLLDGKTLNQLVLSKGFTSTIYSKGKNAVVYANSTAGGEVLLGAIRSIDGNHQWQPVAPGLPRRRYNNTDKRITEQTCRRFGYPRSTAYPLVDSSYPLDESDGGRLSCAGFEHYGNYLVASRRNGSVGIENNQAVKGGFRLWQDPKLRQGIFNHIFKGPLSPGICLKLKSRPQLASQHGCNPTGAPYPAAYAEQTRVRRQTINQSATKAARKVPKRVIRKINKPVRR